MRHWRVLRVLVLTRPVLLASLLVFYAAGVWFIWFAIGTKSDVVVSLAISGLVAFATGCIMALAAERLIPLCLAAGQIGIPRHSATVRFIQVGLATIFMVTPVVAAALAGGPLLAVAGLVCASIAFGVLVPMSRFVAFYAIGGGVALSYAVGIAWVLHPVTHVAAIVASFIVVVAWTLTPARLEAMGANAIAPLADAEHETSEQQLADTFRTTPEMVGRYENAAADAVARAGVTSKGIGISAEAFALGLGMFVRPRWKSILVWTGASIAVLGFSRAVLSPAHAGVVYTVFNVWIAMALWGAMEALVKAWSSTHDEQTLILLAPHGLQNSQLKIRFLHAQATLQVWPWITWLVTNAIAVIAGWVPVETAARAGFGVLAMSVASSACAWALLARRSLSTWHVSTLVILFCGVAGTLLVILGPQNSPAIALAGAALALVPPIAAGLAFALRPMQFPVMTQARGSGIV